MRDRLKSRFRWVCALCTRNVLERLHDRIIRVIIIIQRYVFRGGEAKADCVIPFDDTVIPNETLSIIAAIFWICRHYQTLSIIAAIFWICQH
jgi:hypothetical protein